VETEKNTGVVIDRAYDIIRKVYHEINNLKNDITSTIQEIDPMYECVDEYSYGPHSLYLKEYQMYLYKNQEEDSETQDYLGVIILFSSVDRNHKKVTTIEGPEIWFCKINAQNKDKKYRCWNIINVLYLDDRKYYHDGKILIGGYLNEYRHEDKESDEIWEGKIIGYPLTEIKDKEFLKNNILEKLFI